MKDIIPKSTHESAIPTLINEIIQKFFATSNQLENGTFQSLNTLKVIKSDRKILKSSIPIL